MLTIRTSTRTLGSCRASRSRAAAVRCNVFVKHEQLMAAVTAGALLLAPAPASASLPEGLRGPQGSDSAAIEAKLDALIEQRTGKAAPLPELTEVPQVAETKVQKPAPAVPLVAPMAPAVMEPPPPPAAVAPAAVAPAAVEPAVVESPKPAPAKVSAAPVVAVEEAPAPAKTGLQQRNAPTAAAPASNSGLLIGGAVAVLGVLAAAALSNQSAEQTSAAAPTPATAPASPHVDATPTVAESAAGADSAEGTNSTTN